MEENIEELQRYVPNVHFEQIPIKNLVSDQNYQRNLSLRHVEKAVGMALIMCLMDSILLKSWHWYPIPVKLLSGV